MIRVLFDANVWLSYMMAPDPSRPLVEMMHRCLENTEIEILLPRRTLEEIERTLSTKSFFRKRKLLDAWHAQREDLLQLLTVIQGQEEFERIGRDPNDDYLLAVAVNHNVDYLVTGDNDLLVLGVPWSNFIMSTGDFTRLVVAGLIP